MIDIKGILLKIIEIAKTPIGWIMAFFAYFAPIQNEIILLMIVVTADFITGLSVSYKMKIPRSSSRFKNSIVKIFCYFGAVFIFWQFEIRLDLELINGTYKMITGFIALVEIISILENMAIITENPIFLKIIKLIRGKAAQKGGSLVEDIFNEKNENHLKK